MSDPIACRLASSPGRVRFWAPSNAPRPGNASATSSSMSWSSAAEWWVGRRARRRRPRTEGGAGRSPRLRLRHIEPVLKDVSRRPALPRTTRIRIGPRGPLRARVVLTLAPHLVKPLPFLYPLTKRWWERPYAASQPLALRPARWREKSVPAQALTRAGALRLSPGSEAERADRRDPLLRHRRRRRAAHA